MKTLSDALTLAQKRPLRIPAALIRCRQYGHPQKAAAVQWGMFGWEQLYETDTISPITHGVAIPEDGSLIRIRSYNVGLYYQRIENPGPGSDFGAEWTRWNTPGNFVACAISACGSRVMAVCSYISGLHSNVHISNDCGVNWTDSMRTSLTGTAAMAVAFKDSDNAAVVFADVGSANLKLHKWNSSTGWSTTAAISSPPVALGLAMYYDGDWNIIVLVQNGTTLSLARLVFGDGYRVAYGTWSYLVNLNTGSATIDDDKLLNQYLSGLAPYSDFEQALEEYDEASHVVPEARHWSAIGSILIARATDNLDLDTPFICKPSGSTPILSTTKIGEKWFFRLRPGTDFFDADWNKAFKLDGSCSFGLALATDGTYLWGTRANEVWRARLPGMCWYTPTAGSGAHEEYEDIPLVKLRQFNEVIRPLARSELYVRVDNADGSYSSLPTTHIRRGSRIELGYGYRTTEDETPGGEDYFIENWWYDRGSNKAIITLYCIDAWGLLEHYTVPGPAEFNLGSDEYTVYDLIEKIVECIGGTLDYKSRSSIITSLYPDLEVRPGESAAAILRRLLEMVPDVIYFSGLTAYIVYPQESDSYTYEFYFPPGQGSLCHQVLDGSYRTPSPRANRIYVIGKDSEGSSVFGEDEDCGDIDLVGERLDMQLQPHIPTEELAEQAAAAALAKERLSSSLGSILVPPHCGVELWDVIRIHDSLCAQEAQDYRVKGIRVEFDQEKGSYQQRLFLCVV